jgi:hypothetical protein
MAHIGERGFDTIGGAVVSTTAFILERTPKKHIVGNFVRLIDGRSEAEKSDLLLAAIIIAAFSTKPRRLTSRPFRGNRFHTG